MGDRSSQLVFIRHGQAEEAAADDHLRPLTAAGFQDVQNIIPDLQRCLPPDLPLHLWSSPKLRAVQTAEIIAAGIGMQEIVRQNFISGGDYAALSRAAHHLKRPFCLLIVGHQPHLGSWSQKVSGRLLPFAKGAAAGCTVTSLNPLRAVPMWMIQPRALHLGKIDIVPDQPAGGEFTKIFRCQLQEIFRQQAEFLATPGEPRTTHQLRVQIRTLRSLLSFIKPLLDQTEYVKVQDLLREAGQMFARIREFDVLMAGWSELLAAHPQLTAGNSVLMGALQAERAAEQAGVYEQVAAGWAAARFFDVLFWLDGLSAEKSSLMAAYEAEPDFALYTKKRFTSQRKKAKKCFADTDFQDLKAVHALRIRYKKLRYVAAVLQPYLQIRDKEGKDPFKAMQDRLGQIVDGQRSLELLQELQRQVDRQGLAFECGILTGYQMGAADQALTELKKH